MVQPDPMAVGGANCTNSGFGSFSSGLADVARAGEVVVDLTQRVGQTNFISQSRPVWLDPISSTGTGAYPVLDQESLANLFEYANTPGRRTVVITLAAPMGQQSACISTGLEPEPICVYGQRRLSLTPDQIGKAGAYLVSTEDVFGNVLQRRYVLTP